MAERPGTSASGPEADAATARYAGLLEASPEELYDEAPCGYLSTLLDGTVAKVNATFLTWTGYSREELVGRRRFSELLTPGGRIYHETHYAPLLRMQGTASGIALEVVRADETRLPVLINSVVKAADDGTPLLIRTTVFDATDRKRYERELLRAQEEARQEARRAAFLLEAATVLAAATGFEETLDRLAAVAVPALGDICLIDLLDGAGRLERVAAQHADPDQQEQLQELRHRYPPDAAGPNPAAMAVRERRSQWAAELTEEFLARTTWDARHAELVRQLGCTSYLSVPLLTPSGVLGAVTIFSTNPLRRFAAKDLGLVEELATQLALVVKKAQQYAEEQRASHTLQASLLPRELPVVAGLDVAVRYLPGTRHVEVGGDFYDMVPLPSGHVVIAVGDVVGHDMTAAATMGQLRSATRALLRQVTGPGELAAQLQETWDVLGLERLATALLAWLDPLTGAVVIANAGHPPPLLVSRDRAEYVPVAPSSPLGVAPPTEPEWSGTLGVGETLLLFTDGLIETRDRDLDDGLARLRTAALELGSTDPQALCNGVLDLLLDEVRSDDVAVLAIRRTAPGAAG